MTKTEQNKKTETAAVMLERAKQYFKQMQSMKGSDRIDVMINMMELGADLMNKEDCTDEIWSSFDKILSQAMDLSIIDVNANMAKSEKNIIQTLCHGMMQMLTDSSLQVARAQKKMREAIRQAFRPAKKPQNKLTDKLAKAKSKKVLAILAVLGVLALAGAVKSSNKKAVKTSAHEPGSASHTMSVLAILAEDPHAFDGITIEDSMAQDSLMMNAKVLDAVDGAFQKAGLIDKDGNLKPMKMVDVSEADALGALQKGLRAPDIYNR